MKLMVVATLLALNIPITAYGIQSASALSACVPPLKDCNKPVKWIADKDDCSCFACEYGKSTQHTGCTNDKKQKAELMKLQLSPGQSDLLAHAPIIKLKGTVTSEGDSVTFVNDEDGKKWEVVNPEALKGYQGNHLQVSAHGDADNKTLQVMSAEKVSGTVKDENASVHVLTNTVANLDNYRPVAETSVKFGFNKDNLTPKAKEGLDRLAGTIGITKGYIIAVEGSADSVGSSEYNYELSRRRANSVIQYLASKYNVPGHKIYVIALGKDKPTEPNKTGEGRADNRQVVVTLMADTVDETNHN